MNGATIAWGGVTFIEHMQVKVMEKNKAIFWERDFFPVIDAVYIAFFRTNECNFKFIVTMQIPIGNQRVIMNHIKLVGEYFLILAILFLHMNSPSIIINLRLRAYLNKSLSKSNNCEWIFSKSCSNRYWRISSSYNLFLVFFMLCSSNCYEFIFCGMEIDYIFDFLGEWIFSKM